MFSYKFEQKKNKIKKKKDKKHFPAIISYGCRDMYAKIFTDNIR